METLNRSTLSLNCPRLNSPVRCSFAGGLTSRRSAPGFTLIELVIAIGIVGIISAIAYPMYTTSMVKGRRSAAEAVLMDIAQREQQYLLDSRAYADKATLNPTVPANVSSFYTIAVTPNVAGAPLSFTASATPLTGTAQASDSTLSIDNTGAKTPSGLW